MSDSPCGCGLGRSFNSPPVYVSGYGVQLRRNGQLPLDWVTGEEIAPGASGITSCPQSKSTATRTPDLEYNDGLLPTPKSNSSDYCDGGLPASFKKQSVAESVDGLPLLTKSKSRYKQAHDPNEKPGASAKKITINFAGLVNKVREGRLRDVKTKDGGQNGGDMRNEKADDHKAENNKENHDKTRDSTFIEGALKEVRYVPAAAAAYESIGGADHAMGLFDISEHPEIQLPEAMPGSVIFENDNSFGPDIVVKEPIVKTKELHDEMDCQESFI
ncbi:unnamed protein product [Diplocarpon coronariae]